MSHKKNKDAQKNATQTHSNCTLLWPTQNLTTYLLNGTGGLGRDNTKIASFCQHSDGFSKVG